MSGVHAPQRLADLFEAGRDALLAQYGSRLQPHQWQAMTAIEQCRTDQRGHIHRQCPDCGADSEMPRSCGHRSCPACQNHTTTQWLERQQAKRLPVVRIPSNVTAHSADRDRFAHCVHAGVCFLL